MRSKPCSVACILLGIAGCPRPPSPPSPGPQEQVNDYISSYRRMDLEPAKIAPPAIDPSPKRIRVGGVVATATPLRPEDATWNQWPDAGPRLFNNRAAHLFELEIRSAGAIAWYPEGTFLELNDASTVLPAAETTEALLINLLEKAYLEERWVLTGDLVDRARGAGPFRASYLPLHHPEGHLKGVVAFPLQTAEEDLADLHVVAVRLTVQVAADEGPVDLVWVFD